MFGVMRRERALSLANNFENLESLIPLGNEVAIAALIEHARSKFHV